MEFLGGIIVNFKNLLQKYSKKVSEYWKTGKVQRTSRITYDVVWNIVLFFLIIGFIGMFFGVGVGAGYFASLVKDEPIRAYESMEKDIYNYEETSRLYFANNVYLGDIRSDIHREETTLDEISVTLKDAVIATEDEYFETHNGIVPKAIVRALLQEFTNSDMKSGGSTLTQQLIKNQILTNEVSFERKAKEILLALRLERFFEKDEILEAYLNIVPYGRDASGRNIAGIQTAAQGIFGLNADEVNIAQAAYLAGLPQSPSQYTPFASGGGLKDEEGIQPGLTRMKVVLHRMYEMEYITEEEYQEALEYDITEDFVTDYKTRDENYPHVQDELVRRATDIIKEKLAEEDGYSLEDLEEDDELNQQFEMLAERDLRQNGYHIHSTIDKKIYDAFQEIVKNYKHYGPDWTGPVKDPITGEVKEITQQVQVSGSLIENNTGRIISFVGGRDFNDEDQYNYATQALRSNGSTMKPLLVYAPAMEKGVLQPGTPIADVEMTYPGTNIKPSNFDRSFHGILSTRTNLANSYNIPAIKGYIEIMNDNPVEEYLEKMGITSLDENEYANPSLSIGGTTRGITIEENTNAYATFANGGKFVDAYMIEKITTSDGEVIYEHEPEPVEVFSPQTSYLTLDMLRDVISNGTGSYVKSQLSHPGVDWYGKTGTSQDRWDIHFVGSNPNVTFSTWLGYNIPQQQCLDCDMYYSHRNMKLWAELVNTATEINPELMAPSNSFERPDGIVSRSICAISGMLPSDLCSEAGLVTTDLFNAKFVPTEVDDSLMRGAYVMVNGKAVIAGPNTPKEFVDGDGLTFNPEFLKRNGYDKLGDITQLFPNVNRSAWEKISLPSNDLGSEIQDDGKAPSAPTSLNNSGKTLSWKASSSKDVVGYRIYRAANPDAKFELVGSTVETEFSIPSNKAVYHVKAVDYFGMESSASKEIVIGDFSEPKEEDKKDNEEDKSSGNNGKNKDNKDNKDNKGNNDNSEQDEGTEEPPDSEDQDETGDNNS
ncbi:penicillin-binding protein [Ornithinibacillus sp. L9]|uniref:Penicillin-binding protein n=1 Tax=Ornithinibacillus caprae TaxID=2678566 RepID=A0A6N8FHN1_9BACI|nr:transglycosylase domain-containing protein [Ornithinibacillus caprae]MUK86818.1 penicillin-binding protein [Ornithinibacillus caprae]